MLRLLLLPSFLFSFVPLPESFYLGNKGEAALSLIAPLVLILASGLVCISWWILSFLVFCVSKFGGLFPDRYGFWSM
jgi:glycosylphosphatidylinositol deacylase